MIKLPHSLHFKLALTFAVFGAMVSLLLSLGLHFVAHNLGERLIDETLQAEIDDYISRRARNPNSLPPSTLSISGYVLAMGEPANRVPIALRDLAPGKYELMLESTPYRVAVADRKGERYFMLFNEVRQRHREQSFQNYLIAAATIMVLVSAGVGWWLAGLIVSPISVLTRRVSRAHPEEDTIDVSSGIPPDEIGLLAGVFGSYLKRMRAFIDREREFTADVSHELRTPLAVVQGVVEIMEDDRRLSEKQHERIARIARANREMIALTNALLLMAREESAPELVQQSSDLCEIVRASIEMHRPLLHSETRTELKCEAHPAIPADATLLGVVVGNFIRNAFSYTKSGLVSISITPNALIITDTGDGIPANELDKVFRRYFKGADSSGAGIGLSLAKRICDRYGWISSIESVAGVGTSVRLSFGSTILDAPLTRN